MNKRQIEFVSLSIRNFLSYGNVATTIDLVRGGTTMIKGRNLDSTNDGEGSNGCGKSTIINAISYALYDRTVTRFKTKDAMVNNINNQDMVVDLTFKKHNTTYRVIRARKVKTLKPTGNWVQLFENGVDITPDSIKATDELIERVINIPFELFIRIVVFSAMKEPFLDLPSNVATEVIEKLFGYAELTEKGEKLKEKSKITKQQIDVEQARIDQQMNEQDRYNQQVASATSRLEQWDENKIEQIDSLKLKIQKLSVIDIEGQVKLHEEKAANETLVSQLQQEKRTLTAEYNVLHGSLTTHNSNINKLRQECIKLKDAKCPRCSQHYEDSVAELDKNELEIENLLPIIADIEQGQTELNTLMTQLQQQIDSVNTVISSTTSQIVIKRQDDLLSTKDDIARYTQQLSTVEQSTNPHCDALTELLSEKMSVEVDYSNLNKLKKLQEHQQFLIKLLTRKDSFIRKMMLNKNLPFLNSRLVKYVNQIGLPHKVEFTPQLATKISKMGREIDFGNLSNGQRSRVNIALSFAFRDVLQQMHTPVNLCILDEVLDVGLDPVGIMAAAKFIKTKAMEDDINMYVISHRDELASLFDKRLIVTMEKELSSISYE